MVEEVRLRSAARRSHLATNITLGIIGGLSPPVATWLVHRTENDIAPALHGEWSRRPCRSSRFGLFKENSRAVLQMA